MRLRTNQEVIELKDFQLKTGSHCESSAMMNALSFMGADFSESMITGLGSAPAFFFASDDAFPFLGGRTHTLLENFCAVTGIVAETASPENTQDAYDMAKDLLKTGIPVVLRVNMRYLPYLHKGKYGGKHTSFGWHFVCLVKIDELSGVAFVTDTAYGELQAVKLDDLKKARNSKEGMFKTENYLYYFKNPSLVPIDLRSAFKQSLNTLVNQYEMPAGGLKALEKLPDDIRNIEKGRNAFILKPLFYTFYGYIEEFGSGGSAFRQFLKAYFLEMSEYLNMEEIRHTAAVTGDTCEKWTSLAFGFKHISDAIGGVKNDRAARNALYENSAEKAQQLYTAEKNVYNAIKSLLCCI